MKKFVLYANPSRDIGLTASGRVAGILEDMGLPYAICTEVTELTDVAAEAAMAVAFGGDGTILHCARAVAAYDVPILGVNLGNKGFIAELEPEELDLARGAFEGRYATESRMMVDVCVYREGEAIYRDFALNEAVVGGVARVIRMSVLGDGRPIMTFSGDGVIVATPTGSTAYSMSAGGPLVEPDAENILVTPVCPHVLSARSYVLTPERTVTVRLDPLQGKTAYLSVDGGDSVPLVGGEEIVIRKSARSMKLVRVTDRSFYEKVSKKLDDRP